MKLFEKKNAKRLKELEFLLAELEVREQNINSIQAEFRAGMAANDCKIECIRLQRANAMLRYREEDIVN